MLVDTTYKRVLLKVSGEALMGEKGFGIDVEVVDRIAADISKMRAMGVCIAIVIGGGNIARGVTLAANKQERVTGDHMGMLATVINALALRSALMRLQVDAMILSAISMPQICEAFSQQRVLKNLDAGKVVIFAAGTGNPFFTTDTAAALRAAEIGADVLIKATQVDGIYDADPKLYKDAKKIAAVSYDEVLKHNFSVMDMTAISLAKENNIPIIIYSIIEAGGLEKILSGSGNFSIIS